MLSLFILLILFAKFFVGLRRGLVLQFFHLVSFFGSMIVAFVFFSPFADYLRLWLPYPQFLDGSNGGMMIPAFSLESVYYNGIAFAILFFATRILLRMIASLLDFVRYLPIVRTLNNFLGGVLGFIEGYLVVFVLLLVAALIPVESVQDTIVGSTVARLIIEQTPFLSQWLPDIWT
ncbi:CvpA family protein [Salicibibacter cibi]|uniref:CvpA family protein n=1 Tax=Salicibibacter cibi TaxID=2743001 RepID=A0A7T6ZCI5_9BACI|nr:CvpA family protein [Salicibibacter cibi]QQK80993.1 CvpA family protein [Salicibibacter cibi]